MPTDVEAGGLRSAFLHDTGDVAPGRIRKPVIPDRRIFSRPDLEVDGVHARGTHGHQYFAGVRLRYIEIFGLDDVLAAEAAEPDQFAHGRLRNAGAPTADGNPRSKEPVRDVTYGVAAIERCGPYSPPDRSSGMKPGSMKKRRRFKQTTSLKERLASFAAVGITDRI
jgi:hypothetical protein